MNKERLFVYTYSIPSERSTIMRNLLKRSLEENRAIEIIYMSHQQFTKRRILVKHLKGDYIVAYCFLRKDIRTFRVQSILAASPVVPRQNRIIS